MATYYGRNPLQQIGKNKDDIEALRAQIDGLGAPDFSEPEGVVYSDSNATIDYTGGNSITLPITGGNGIVVDANDEDLTLDIRIDPHTYYHYSITGVPVSSTNGTLAQDIVDALKAADMAMITFNNENYYKADNQHTTGTLVFSHTGYEAGIPFIKTITVTLSTRAWKLTTIRVPITLVQAQISLLGNIYYTQAIPSTNSDDFEDLYKSFYTQMPISGAFKYGASVYSIISISFKNLDGTGGGTVHCLNLTSGEIADLQFTETQLYVDEVGSVYVPSSNSNFGG